MVTSKPLQDAAEQIAQELEQQSASLQAKLRKIETEKSSVEDALRTANVSLQRLANFRSTDSNGDPLCANCWMREGKELLLVNLGGGERVELYRCRECDFTLSVPI